MKESPEGYVCQTCRQEHRYPAYVYAHWREPLVHTCDNCGAQHEIIVGTATLVKAGEVPGKEAS